MESVRIFRFLNINKDPKTKKIDIYFFIDKLVSLL